MASDTLVSARLRFGGATEACHPSTMVRMAAAAAAVLSAARCFSGGPPPCATSPGSARQVQVGRAPSIARRSMIGVIASAAMYRVGRVQVLELVQQLRGPSEVVASAVVMPLGVSARGLTCRGGVVERRGSTSTEPRPIPGLQARHALPDRGRPLRWMARGSDQLRPHLRFWRPRSAG